MGIGDVEIDMQNMGKLEVRDGELILSHCRALHMHTYTHAHTTEMHTHAHTDDDERYAARGIFALMSFLHFHISLIP
jgi:hypothetical protein